jgi:hypothetical protein
MFMIDLAKNTQQDEGESWVEFFEFNIDFKNLGNFAKI